MFAWQCSLALICSPPAQAAAVLPLEYGPLDRQLEATKHLQRREGSRIGTRVFRFAQIADPTARWREQPDSTEASLVAGSGHRRASEALGRRRGIPEFQS